MAYKLIVTQKAHQDLDDALGYIARKLANPKGATASCAGFHFYMSAARIRA